MRVHLDVVAGRGLPQSLTIEAPSIDNAKAQAARDGFSVLSARSIAGWRQRETSRRSPERLELVVFVEQLRDLLEAGLSLTEALGTLRRASRGTARTTIESLERRLQEGKSFSEALAAGGEFPDLLVALVGASELTSELPQTLGRFLEHEQRVAEVRHRILSTAIYPLLLVAIGGVVLLFLLFYVMPRFARVFEGMTSELPWSARAMLAWAGIIRSTGLWWLFVVVLVVVGLGSLLMHSGWRAVASRRLLELRPIRERLRTYFLARWYRATGLLLEGGIPLATALDLSNRLLPVALRDGGERVLRAVREGLSPAEAHTRGGMATTVAEQLLVAGERTGDLASVLSRVAQFHEAEVSRGLERTMRTLEPLVMVLVGLGVGIVVVLMYLPIFELASAIQ
jgi:general secretion pathway protein F